MSTIVTTRDYTSKCLNVLLWIKFKHNYFLQIAMRRCALSCLHFVCKKRNGRCTISSRIIIIGEGQVSFLQDFDIGWTAKGSVPPELPSSQIAMYFAQTTQPFYIVIISSRIIIIGEGQVIFLQDFDISWTAKGSVPPELPSSQIAMYFAQTTQLFYIVIAIYIASYIAS